MKVAAIVLAAGGSSRLGEPKQLLRDKAGETLVHRTARFAIEAGAEPVVVVAGAVFERVVETVADLSVETAVNNNWQQGLHSSIRAGVHRVAMSDADAVLILTCDMPSVSVSHMQSLVAKLVSGAERVASTYGETRGVPAILRRAEFDALQNLTGDRGAKPLLVQDSTVMVPLPDGAFDLDTRENVDAWRAQE